MAGVNQPKPNPPAENINNATTPDVAAALCEASVAHFHRPARPFHHPRLAPTPQTNTATIAATAGSVLAPTMVGPTFGVSHAVITTSANPPPTSAATRPGCHNPSGTRRLPAARSRSINRPDSVSASLAKPVTYRPPVNSAAPARTATNIWPTPSDSDHWLSPDSCCHQPAYPPRNVHHIPNAPAITEPAATTMRPNSVNRAFAASNSAVMTGRAPHIASLIPPPRAVSASSNRPDHAISSAASSPLRYRLCSAVTAPTTRTLPPAKAATRRPRSSPDTSDVSRSPDGNLCAAAADRTRSRQSVTAVSCSVDLSFPDTSPPSATAKPSGT
ncbi:Uncharacterised protein [Mycobacteroides abscessus subsp. abscessus]|nr:Uncharacterised protein [Mycobacteroides abscessus subsp. abscessus]